MACPCSNTNRVESEMAFSIPVPVRLTAGDYNVGFCLNLNASCGECTETFDLSPCPDLDCPPTPVTFPVFRVTGTVDAYISRNITDECGNQSALCLENPVSLTVDFSCTLCPDANCPSLADSFNQNACDFLDLGFVVDEFGDIIPVVSLIDCDLIRERSVV